MFKRMVLKQNFSEKINSLVNCYLIDNFFFLFLFNSALYIYMHGCREVLRLIHFIFLFKLIFFSLSFSQIPNDCKENRF